MTIRSTLDNANKFLRLVRRKRSPYPEEIQVEVTNACNLTCSMCPHTHGLIPQNNFSLALFQNLVRENPSPRRLVLTGWGEPLMHPQLLDMIETANESWPDCSVRFTSNGILLDAVWRERLRQVNVAAVTVSVDLWPESKAWSPEWKDILHPPSPKSFRNIQEYFADRELMRRAPLILQLVMVQENIEDIQKYIELAAKHGALYVNIVRMQTYPGLEITRMPWEEEQEHLAQLIRFGQTQGVQVRTLNHQKFLIRLATGYDRICMRTDDSLYITVDGTCTPCCNLREYSIGSVTSGSTVQEIWHAEEEEKFFRDQHPVCGGCDALFHTYRS